ncbi:MAG: DUF4153 domain-containing protein [Burkholderiaceae bacterium]|nr:DUF4153 domain-containing protein [Burkholderiaceae bacterium]
MLTAAIQAAALYLLTDAAKAPLSWPATEPPAFVPLLVVFSYIPLLLLLGFGQVRARPLALWATVAIVIVASLGVHDALRGRAADFTGAESFWPSPQLWLALTGSLFVAHVLVIDSIIEKRLLISYPRHFDTAWKVAVQCGLAAVFVGVFWGVLHLGAGLFRLVDITYFTRLIEKRWFAFPATTLALAVAIHVTDVQPALIRGARSMALTLFSWLLPLLVAILFGFLVSLPFISLAPLWKTHFATALLLVSAGFVVLLMNSCYQDGALEQTQSRIKRFAVLLGAFELIPLVALAAWALALRVGQYGWTVERIFAASVILIAACYAIGYAGAAVRSPTWMKRMEITNVVTAYVALSVVLVLFSPIADPARLTVLDQVERLQSGAVPPDKFDFAALKFDGARWGRAALEQLAEAKEGAEAATIAERAKRALALTNRYAGRNPPRATAAEMAERVAVYPAGRTLPAAFFEDAFVLPDSSQRPYCQTGMRQCLARFVSLGPGQREAIVFIDGRSIGYLFEQDASGPWKQTAHLQGNFSCNGAREEIENGAIALQPHTWPDIVVGSHRIEINSLLGMCGSPW